MKRTFVSFLVVVGMLVVAAPAARAATATPITQCETLSVAGSYVVTADLIATSPYVCLQIGGTKIHVNCKNHTILGAVAFVDSTKSSVSNCALNYPSGNPYPNPDALIEMLSDNGDTATANTINGNSQGAGNGADDGILISNATNDVISDNKISDTYDTGIEGDNFVSHSMISGNTISDEGNYGIGAWWYSSWLDNTVKRNTVSDSYEIFEFDNYCGVPSGQSTVYFEGNLFNHNTFTDPKPLFGVGEMIVNVEQAQGCMPNGAPMVTSGNVLTDNNFGTTEQSVALAPYSAFVDGGGNVCNLSDQPVGYPIVCNG